MKSKWMLLIGAGVFQLRFWLCDSYIDNCFALLLAILFATYLLEYKMIKKEE